MALMKKRRERKAQEAAAQAAVTEQAEAKAKRRRELAAAGRLRTKQRQADIHRQRRRILTYRRQRGLVVEVYDPTAGRAGQWRDELGSLDDLTGPQRRRVRHAYNRGLARSWEEVLA